MIGAGDGRHNGNKTRAADGAQGLAAQLIPSSEYELE